MNLQENTVSVNDTLNALQVTEQPQCKEKNEVRKYYLHIIAKTKRTTF